MSMDRTCGPRWVTVITLVTWSWFAVIVSFGDSIASAQQPQPATPDDAAFPEPSSPPTVAPRLAQLLASYQRTPSRTRLASVPKMFGDSIGRIAGLSSQPNGVSVGGGPPVDIGIPIGSSRASKVGDHNAALPVDRIYFNFNHFHGALDATVGANPIAATDSQSINRYTFGWERTFLEGLWSVELRMPFTETYGLAIPALGGTATGGGNVGNLAVVLKRMIYETDDTVVALGLVLDTPTGEGTFARIGTTNYLIDNNVMGILPYLGMLYSPDDRHFMHAFLQTDIPLGDNTVHTADAIGMPLAGNLENFTQPTLMYLDVSGGYWLYQDPSAAHITGLAALLEFHYTTTLHQGQSLIRAIPTDTFRLGSRSIYSDVVNLTVALDAQFANRWNVRIGGVIPLGADDRFFDSELAVQATRYF